MPKAVDALVASVAALIANVDNLTKMVAGLEKENQALRQQLLSQPPPSNDGAIGASLLGLTEDVKAMSAMLQTCEHPTSVGAKGAVHAQLANEKTFAEVVTASVKTALRDEKSKSEVIVAQMPENKKDDDDIKALCDKAGIVIRPTTITRLGKPSAERTRPVKLTLPTPFDARAFLAKMEETRRNATEDAIKSLRCRPCRSHNDQIRHQSLSAKVHKLNQDAKASGNDTESYSLRSSGEIWKYAKCESGRWKRVIGWSVDPSSLPEPVDSGNGVGEQRS
jgi:hypothetical protein